MEGELMDLLIMGFGAGAKGTIAGYITKFLPDLTEDVASVVAGFLMYKFGGRVHPLVQKFGAGVLIAGIGQFTKGLIEKFVGGGGGGHRSPRPRSPQVAPANQLKALAEMEAGKRAVYS